MKTKLTLLTLTSAGLLSAASQLRATDPVPPTPPVTPAAPAASVEARPARGPGGPGGQRGDRLAAMKETLGLTPEQVEKLKPIVEKDREKMMAMREDTTLSREQKAAKVQELMKASADEIKAILTPDQLEKWKAEQEKRREAMQKRRAEQEKK